VSTKLGIGKHELTTIHVDAAGNESEPSPAFTLTIERPSQPSQPDTLIDGMPVQVAPVVLPGGVPGTTISVPIVTSGRNETNGDSSVADIPLATSGGSNLLLAQLAPGFGLSTSGANVGVASGLD